MDDQSVQRLQNNPHYKMSDKQKAQIRNVPSSRDVEIVAPRVRRKRKSTNKKNLHLDEIEPNGDVQVNADIVTRSNDE